MQNIFLIEIFYIYSGYVDMYESYIYLPKILLSCPSPKRPFPPLLLENPFPFKFKDLPNPTSLLRPRFLFNPKPLLNPTLLLNPNPLPIPTLLLNPRFLPPC